MSYGSTGCVGRGQQCLKASGVGGGGDQRLGDAVTGPVRPLPAQQGPEGLPVARAHGVVHRDVEGGVDVGHHVHRPDEHHEEVVVTATGVHLRHEQPGQPE